MQQYGKRQEQYGLQQFGMQLGQCGLQQHGRLAHGFLLMPLVRYERQLEQSVRRERCGRQRYAKQLEQFGTQRGLCGM
jgi:hypothetical protein